jgi:hypothetical protein
VAVVAERARRGGTAHVAHAGCQLAFVAGVLINVRPDARREQMDMRELFE